MEFKFRESAISGIAKFKFKWKFSFLRAFSIHFLGFFWATFSVVWHCIQLWRQLSSVLTVMCWLSFCLLEQRLPSPHAADILCIIYNKNDNHIIFLNIMKEFRPWAQLKFLFMISTSIDAGFYIGIFNYFGFESQGDLPSAMKYLCKTGDILHKPICVWLSD